MHSLCVMHLHMVRLTLMHCCVLPRGRLGLLIMLHSPQVAQPTYPGWRVTLKFLSLKPMAIFPDSPLSRTVSSK